MMHHLEPLSVQWGYNNQQMDKLWVLLRYAVVFWVNQMCYKDNRLINHWLQSNTTDSLRNYTQNILWPDLWIENNLHMLLEWTFHLYIHLVPSRFLFTMIDERDVVVIIKDVHNLELVTYLYNQQKGTLRDLQSNMCMNSRIGVYIISCKEVVVSNML